MKAKIVASLFIVSLVMVGWVWVMTNAVKSPAQIEGIERAPAILLIFLTAGGIVALLYLILTWLWKE